MGGDTVVVKMAEMSVVRNGSKLKTTLGSCVGIVLHDVRRGSSGLAHVMLPSRSSRDDKIGKYADTAIPELMKRLLRMGSRKQDLQAYLVGGANMFLNSSEKKIATVGEKNIEATRTILESLAIPVVYEDCGGSHGRTFLFDPRSAEVDVKTFKRFVSSKEAG